MTVEIIEMLEQSGVIALVGMGIVFSFLIIMVFAISISSGIIRKFEKTNTAVPAQGAAAQASSDGAITAAITAAVTEYRKK